MICLFFYINPSTNHYFLIDLSSVKTKSHGKNWGTCGPECELSKLHICGPSMLRQGFSDWHFGIFFLPQNPWSEPSKVRGKGLE